ncbi:discoidin domain-containing protein [Streptomyces sp. LHD-70]|uniref:discoidin domain-containing protein n=1 Tax=Streptomyces sp. LHD-70 TaxID=3072140 RepID=UPI00280D2018|nr:discoidin domain-containing protein [Streptomyces sp. LHD-70]MDQ8702865.1 discoidin domain-containing protein [Streptomyces sp. LHD-70]
MKYSSRLLACTLTALLAGAVPPVASAKPDAPAPQALPSHGPSAGSCPAEGHPRSSDDWALSSSRIDPKELHHAYVGNGYLGQRVPPRGSGYADSDAKTGWPLFTPRYDGSFVSGLYANNPETAKNLQAVAALPNWSGLTVNTGKDTFGPGTPASRISRYRQTQFLACGLVRTSFTWTSADGRSTDLVYDVLADRNNPHVGAVRLRMTPHWNGDATVTDVLDGRGARRMSQTGGPRTENGTVGVSFRTDGTKVDGTVASTLRPGRGVEARPASAPRAAADLTARQSVDFPVRAGRSYDLTKYVGVDTELTSPRPGVSAVRASRRAAERGWDSAFAAHRDTWRRLWSGDVEIPGRPDLQAWARSARYGLLSNLRAGASDSIAPTGLTSDNYAGLVFWDAETWMFPSLLAFDPELARSVVDYRYRTRTAARANARKLGHSGLFYAWTSGAKGDLWKECHSWDPPHCRTQNHLQGDIALAVWQYYQGTGDRTWLRERGWPVLKGIAEFWADRAERNGDGSYSVHDVAGPDEYSNGVNDGAFTNAGAATALRNATRAAALVGEQAPARWELIADKLRVPYDKDKKVFLQYDGYKGSTIKQADTVLLQYPLECPMSAETARNTLDYYAARTDPDGPAMTDSVHAIGAATNGEPGCSAYTYLLRSIKPFVRGPFAQFSEARGDKAGAEDPLAGSPAQDFLTGKGGFLQVFTHGLTGLRWREDHVRVDPMLPPQLKSGVNLRGVRWQGRTFDIELGPRTSAVRLVEGKPFDVTGPQGRVTVSQGAPAILKTRRPDLEPTANLARCRPVSGNTPEPGRYAEAAVDGSTATAWVPEAREDSLRVGLARPATLRRVDITWTEPRPASHRVETSLDGRHWQRVTVDPDSGELAQSVVARHVRVSVRGTSEGAGSEDRPGIGELRVE